LLLRMFCRRKLPPVRAATGVTDLRRYPVPMRFSSNDYFFFLVVFLAFLAFFAFLAMLPSVVPKVSFSASRPSTCTFRIHHNYKFDTARFEEGKRPSYRRGCDRTKLSRDAWAQRALADQDDKKFSHGQKKLTTAKLSRPLARSTA
jgi:hypothetical protein